MLFIALISEQTRVRMRNNLLVAEQAQRKTNDALQREIERRSHSEKALAQSETRYRALFEESPLSLWEEDWSRIKTALNRLAFTDREDLQTYFEKHPGEVEAYIEMIQVTAVNKAMVALFDADSVSDLLKGNDHILYPDRFRIMTNRMAAMHKTGRYEAQLTTQTLKGRPLHLLVSSTIPAGYEDSWRKVYLSIYDLSERVALEAEKERIGKGLQNAREFQAIASLAGGIAHQFNNSLSVIYGSLNLMEINNCGDQTHVRYIESIKEVSVGMSWLTDQLLAYARSGKYQPKHFSLNDIVAEFLNSEQFNKNKAIRITPRLEPDLLPTRGDINQITTVLESVLTNAVESMEKDGEIFVTTGNQVIERGVGEPSPGSYSTVVVEDSGIGMDAETLRRVFDPFFSTKFYGRGLGMAAAYGIIKNHGGSIDMVSEPNHGTRVTIFLPEAYRQKQEARSEPQADS